MSERVRIARGEYSGIDVSPQFIPYTKVILTVGSGENQGIYTAGYDGGRVLELENPWGNQQI
ncbi:MAG: hypothetical protein IJT94_00150, partial [Oscillibacter sp.]|nr:hypothetical protein [Oscillibacter sp.]